MFPCNEGKKSNAIIRQNMSTVNKIVFVENRKLFSAHDQMNNSVAKVQMHISHKPICVLRTFSIFETRRPKCRQKNRFLIFCFVPISHFYVFWCRGRKIELLMPKSKVVRFKFCSTFNIQLKVTKTQPTLSLSLIFLIGSFFILHIIVHFFLDADSHCEFCAFFLLHEFVAKQRMLLA